MKALCFLLLYLFIVTNATAQTNVLSQFTGFQQGLSIQLSFTIKGGNTCLGTEIQRSDDGIHFTTIGMIAGICGNNDKDETYTFEDKKPLVNQRNYYRLVLGQLGTTESINVLFVNYGTGLTIIPNPVTDGAVCYFQNDNNELVRINIFDASGILHTSIITRDHFVELTTTKFTAGIYFISLEQDEIRLHTQKFVVQ